MPNAVTNGALVQCSFGLVPVTLIVLPVNRVLAGGQPMANILDSKPFVNIVPFGMCNSPANPAVIAARAAAFGAPVPGPCVPVTAPWAPGMPTVLVGGAPGLNNSSKCMCTWAGVISVTMTPAMTVGTP